MTSQSYSSPFLLHMENNWILCSNDYFPWKNEVGEVEE